MNVTTDFSSELTTLFLSTTVLDLVGFIFVTVSYVFQALSLYTIASRRGIKHAWMAWVPLVNMWIFGSIADQYQYVVNGRLKNRRTTLLVLQIVVDVLAVVVIVQAFSVIANVTINAFRTEEELLMALVPQMMNMMGGIFVLLVLAIPTAVVQYIALYDIFKSCSRDDAVLYLVLSIIFSFVQPFLLFACRNSDQGMPPRRNEIPQSTWQPPRYSDPWNS